MLSGYLIPWFHPVWQHWLMSGDQRGHMFVFVIQYAAAIRLYNVMRRVPSGIENLTETWNPLTSFCFTIRFLSPSMKRFPVSSISYLEEYTIGIYTCCMFCGRKRSIVGCLFGRWQMNQSACHVSLLLFIYCAKIRNCNDHILNHVFDGTPGKLHSVKKTSFCFLFPRVVSSLLNCSFISLSLVITFSCAVPVLISCITLAIYFTLRGSWWCLTSESVVKPLLVMV